MVMVNTKLLTGIGLLLALSGMLLGIAEVDTAWSETSISPVWALLLGSSAIFILLIIQRRKVMPRRAIKPPRHRGPVQDGARQSLPSDWAGLLGR